MKNVLVTSGETRMALAVCRALSGNGYRVFAGSRRSCSMTSVSRHCAGSMVYASPFTEQKQFIEDIDRFIQKNQIDILLPVLEETFTIAKHRSQLESRVAFAIPEYASILAVHNKGILAGLAAQLGIPVPATLELAVILSCPDELSRLSFPVLLKPKQGGGGWGMQRFDSPDTLLAFASTHIAIPQHYIVQTIIEGNPVCACTIYAHGLSMGGDMYKPIRSYPLGCGQATIRETVTGGEALKSLQVLLDHLGWHGVCEADFLVDATGKAWLLDINPRFWGSLGHNIAAGVNYPLYYCQLCLNESFSVPPAHPGTRTGWLGGDTMRFLVSLLRSENKATHLGKAWQTRTPVAHYDDWAMNDPLPIFAWAWNVGLNTFFKNRKDALPGIWE